MSLLQVEQFWLINLNPTQTTYIMDATFVELPPFERHRAQYFNDEEFRGFQRLLLKQPDAGAVIQGTGGLRRYALPIRHGKKASAADCVSSTPTGFRVASSGRSPCMEKMCGTI
ncbi:hypothetical protein [Duganella phyllosphaerae]|uniref:hypothetical protein n=1 Tax=Duganella phyllosphaerae TaxID=762836 RepID=UPI001E2CE68D|nr:hypothetical protein [Duganella phyllosphaerae]